ncbi:MAG: DUF2059 domain-containing protein [Pseudomonadota bacterium]
MRKRCTLVLALLLAAPLAHAVPPTDAQLDALHEAARTERLLEEMWPRIEAMQRQMLQQALQGREHDPEAQARAQRSLERGNAALHKALSWERLRPLLRDVYRRHLEAEDVEAITAFYRTPAGQKLLDKGPALMQASMEAVQPLLMEVPGEMEKELRAEAGSP